MSALAPREPNASSAADRLWVATLWPVLRAAFWLTALLFIPVGLFLYFFPPSLVALAGFSPLWLVRVMGGLLLAWGAYQVAASTRPDGAKVGGLAGGNLLTVAALLPATLKTGGTMLPALHSFLLLLCAFLTILAVIALLAYPERRA